MEKEAQEIGQIVIERAMEIFDKCGSPKDFCVQNIGMFSAVFGGTNRIVWTVGDGFFVDETYCTEKFLEAFEENF